MKNWPKDGKPVTLDTIVDPLLDALDHCYEMERRNEDQDVKYDGLDIGQQDKAIQPSPDERLTALSLKNEFKDQGRDAAQVILGLAAVLGIEQGRRLESQNVATTLEALKILLSSISDRADQSGDGIIKNHADMASQLVAMIAPK